MVERVARSTAVRKEPTMPTTHFTVAATSWVTPTLRRISLRTDNLSAFAGSEFTDRYVKLIFPKPGIRYSGDVDVRALRGSVPPEELPDVRTYTALNPNITAGTLDIDFVIHGDEGIAGPWAARAEIGDELLVNGPGGAYKADATADWHLLVGDESAFPAIAATVTALPRDAVARVLLVVDSPEHEPELALPSNGTLTFVYRDGSSTSPDLASALRALDWPSGRVHAFVHGEAEETMLGMRPYLRTERGLGRDQLSISGYWRRGRTEDGFREWKSALAEAESGDGLRGRNRPAA